MVVMEGEEGPPEGEAVTGDDFVGFAKKKNRGNLRKRAAEDGEGAQAPTPAFGCMPCCKYFSLFQSTI